MPEAVIVSAARSPIGRAGKGSLNSGREISGALQICPVRLLALSPLSLLPSLFTLEA